MQIRLMALTYFTLGVVPAGRCDGVTLPADRSPSDLHTRVSNARCVLLPAYTAASVCIIDIVVVLPVRRVNAIDRGVHELDLRHGRALFFVAVAQQTAL